MKIFKHRNIMGLIYGVILAIPMLSILVRSAYVVVNKNAKDSYSDYEISKVFQVNDNVSYINGVDYIIAYENINDTNSSTLFGFSDIDFDISQCEGYVEGLTYNYIFFNQQYIYFTPQRSYQNACMIIGWGSTFTKIELTSNGDTIGDAFAHYGNINVVGLLKQNGTLDNAFDYSLSEYVSENSFGNLNFFEWWSNLFLDLNNPKSALYIHFVNWYMNYVLFVSSSYILFMVLMWFINYSRRLMERGLNYDW